MLVAWLLFPLVLVATTLGCGLLVDRAVGARLPLALLPASGLAVVVVATSLLTMADATAELAVPVVVALGAAGLVTGFATVNARFDPYAVGVGLASYLAFGAPVLASGEATFAGYVKLDDTASYLGVLDHVLEHGRNVSGLEPSTYEALVTILLGDAYPVGSVLPLGLTELVRMDSAWTWQPYLSLLGAFLAMVLYELAGDLVRTRWLRAFAAVAASCSALLFGYALWGGVKELFAAVVLALLVATVPRVGQGPTRAAVVPAFAAAALLDGLSAAAAIWLAPLLGVLLLVGWRTRAWGAAAIAMVTALVLAAPALVLAPGFVDDARGVARGTDNVGNLLGPLNPLQMAGIWPSRDFRIEPQETRATIALVTLVIVAAAGAAYVAVARRAWRLIVLLATGLVSALVFAASSGPWIEAKAFAAASPFVLLLALLAGGLLVERGRLVEGALVLVALGGGVLWSNALAAGDANLAPRDRLAELEEIGRRYAGQGPALMTEYNPYGVRHFLRRLDPEGASELRRRLVQLRDGSVLEKGETAPIDAFSPDAVQVYRTLVLLRSGQTGAPPGPFRLVAQGRYYDVWQQ